VAVIWVLLESGRWRDDNAKPDRFVGPSRPSKALGLSLVADAAVAGEPLVCPLVADAAVAGEPRVCPLPS